MEPNKKWNFVTQIVLTYCEKKKLSCDLEKLLKFEAEGKTFEITRTIYSNNERSEQFLKKKMLFQLISEGFSDQIH